MPFLSKDWRSPGETWVRFQGGWEMQKTVGVPHQFRIHGGGSSAEDSGCEPDPEVGSWGSAKMSDHSDPDSFQDSSGSLLMASRRFHQYPPSHTLPCKKKCGSGLDQVPGSTAASLPNRPQTEGKARSRPISSQPYFPITIKSTKEVAGFNALAEALLRLGFVTAVRDIRRFDYISKIMYSLFSHERLFQLPGNAQKVLFRILEEMADVVYSNNRNEYVLRKLMDELNATMTIYHVWGSHLGSSNLFRQHDESRRRITEMVEKKQVRFKQDLASSTTTSAPGLVKSLPEECIREILLRLSDPKDLERAGDTCVTMSTIAREKRVWRELVQTHFTKDQIDFVLGDNPELKEQKDWKKLYKRLRWKFGLRETYTETLNLCRKCNCLFWASLGHPCLVEATINSSRTDESSSEDEASLEEHAKKLVSISPQTFLSYFSV